MKKRLRIFWYPILGICLPVMTMIYSCTEKLNLISPAPVIEGKQDTVAIDNIKEMKRWFEDSIRSRSALKTAIKLNKDVRWEFAYEQKSARNEVYVMTPITYKDHLITTSEEGGKFETIDLTSLSRSYLLLRKGSDKRANIVTYVADKSYFAAKDQIIEGPGFSGKIYVKDWEENFLYGFIVKDGKTIGDLSPANSTGSTNGRTSCLILQTPVYSITCVPAMGYCNEPQFLYYQTTQICPRFVDNPDQIDWDQLPPYSGGGSSDPRQVYEYVIHTAEGQEFLLGCANEYERNYYLSHPWLILEARRNKNEAKSKTISYYGTDADDGKNNAFKHAFWTGLNVLSWDDGIARFLGELHEAGVSNNALSKKMDLYNNELGNNIGLQIKMQYSDPKDQVTELRIAIKTAIDDGGGRYINNGQLTETDK